LSADNIDDSEKKNEIVSYVIIVECVRS
jgi:hypothetical protein